MDENKRMKLETIDFVLQKCCALCKDWSNEGMDTSEYHVFYEFMK